MAHGTFKPRNKHVNDVLRSKRSERHETDNRPNRSERNRQSREEVGLIYEDDWCADDIIIEDQYD